MVECKDCRAFQPKLYLSKFDRCQFGLPLYDVSCSCFCITYEQWHEIWEKRFH